MEFAAKIIYDRAAEFMSDVTAAILGLKQLHNYPRQEPRPPTNGWVGNLLQGATTRSSCQVSKF